MDARNKKCGQATLELALLLPILFFLLYWVISGFKVNHDSGDRSIRRHAEALKKFDHGNNMDAINIDGVDLVPGRYSEIIPDGGSFNIGNFVKDLGLGVGTELGLNALFSNVAFFGGYKWYGAASREFLRSTATQYVSAGEVNWKTSAFAGATGALTSGQAKEAFTGVKSMPAGFIGPLEKNTGVQEFWGSASRTGLIAFTNSQGDLKQIVPGAVGGMLSSNSAQSFGVINGNDILHGAAKGAITSAVAGVFSGNFDLKKVGISTATSAFTTKSMAKIFTNDSYTGDARTSASFGAANAMFATLINGGDAKSALYAGAAGAFFSRQTMGWVDGKDNEDHKWIDSLQQTGAGIGFNAAMDLTKGAGLSAIGDGFYNSLLGSGQSYATKAMLNQMPPSLRYSLSGAASAYQVYDYLRNPGSAKQLAQEISSQAQVQALSAINPPVGS